MARKWEYQLISSGDLSGGGLFSPPEREALEAHLNRLGDDGWEIVGIDFITTEGSPRYFHALARRER